MKKLTAGLLIFLIAASLSLTLVPNGISQTSTVKIVSYSYYMDSLGYIVAVGEVQNNGPNTLDYVTVTGTLTTADGLQATSGINAWGFQLLPNQKAPFYLEFHSQSTSDGTFYGQTIQSVNLQVTDAPATSKYQYPGLSLISQHSTQTTVGEYFVDCDIKNTGSQAASDVIVAATFYNSTGQVIAVGYSNQTNLSPGATAFLRAGAFDLNQTGVSVDRKITSYSALVQTSGPLLEGNAPVPVATPTPGPSVIETPGPDSGSSDSGSGNAGNIEPNGSDQNLTLAVGIVVVIVVVVAALLLLTRRRKPKPDLSASKTKSASRRAKSKRD